MDNSRKRVLPVNEEYVIGVFSGLSAMLSLFLADVIVVTAELFLMFAIMCIAVRHRNRYVWCIVLVSLLFTALLNLYYAEYDMLCIIGLVFLFITPLFLRKNVRLLYKVYLRL